MKLFNRGISLTVEESFTVGMIIWKSPSPAGRFPSLDRARVQVDAASDGKVLVENTRHDFAKYISKAEMPALKLEGQLRVVNSQLP